MADVIAAMLALFRRTQSSRQQKRTVLQPGLIRIQLVHKATERAGIR